MVGVSYKYQVSLAEIASKVSLIGHTMELSNRRSCFYFPQRTRELPSCALCYNFRELPSDITRSAGVRLRISQLLS